MSFTLGGREIFVTQEYSAFENFSIRKSSFVSSLQVHHWENWHDDVLFKFPLLRSFSCRLQLTKSEVILDDAFRRLSAASCRMFQVQFQFQGSIIPCVKFMSVYNTIKCAVIMNYWGRIPVRGMTESEPFNPVIPCI